MDNHYTLKRNTDDHRSRFGNVIVGIKCGNTDKHFVADSLYIPGMEFCPYCGETLDWKSELEKVV